MVNTGRVDRGVGSEFLRVSLKFGSAATFDFLPTMHQIGEPPQGNRVLFGLAVVPGKTPCCNHFGHYKSPFGKLALVEFEPNPTELQYLERRCQRAVSMHRMIKCADYADHRKT